MKSKKVEFNLKLLQKISEYYEFPLAVFCLPNSKILKGTRRNYWKRKIVKLKDVLTKFIEEL